MEYGFSCMGYELAGAMGTKLACQSSKTGEQLGLLRLPPLLVLEGGLACLQCLGKILLV